MNDFVKTVRIAGGVAAIIAGVLMIVVSNTLIYRFMPVYGELGHSTALVILAYVIISVSVLSKLFSVIMIAGRSAKNMAIGVVGSQIVLMALEITTVIILMRTGLAVSALNYIFMIFSVLAVVLAIVYIVKQAARSDSEHTLTKNFV